MKETITIITGPTSIGKSRYASELAKKTNSEIISMDSMQIYKLMDIGTAKPSPTELKEVPHHLIDIINPDESFSVVTFIQSVQNIINNNPNQKYIIVGGTGLYLNALLDGLAFPAAPPNPELREKLRSQADELGSKSLWDELKKVDPAAVQKITPNDTYRLVRALEVYQTTGKPISTLQEKDKSIIPNRKVIALTTERGILYKQIEKRVDIMIEKGLATEVESLLAKGYSKELPSLKAIGYKEIIQYLNGELRLDEAIEKIKKGTRNFAKRQYTWFRKFPEIEWIDSPYL